MRTIIGAALVTFVVIAAAFAQAPDQLAPPMHQTEMSTTGTIASIDLAQGTLTLYDGTEFRLPPSFQYTSFPAIGQDVEVIYDEQGGQKVVRSIDQGFEGKSND